MAFRGVGASARRRPSWARAGLLLSALIALAAASCGDDDAEGQVRAVCEEVYGKLRGCELVSEGELDCWPFENDDYRACIVECVRPASCEDIFAQTCDDIDNEFALCLDDCLLTAFASVRCGDDSRVSIDRVCDGVNDCNDGADEARCDEPEPQFVCDDGERVALDGRCDGSSDCRDGSDEAGCPSYAMTVCPGGF